MSGWVKLHRKFLEWEWYDDHNTTRMFIHMLLKANHDGKKWRGILIQPGQFVGSVSKLSEETGISVQSIRTCIDRLKSTGEVTSKSTSRYTLFTLVKWGMYQDFDDQANKQINGHSNNQLTNNQQTANKRLTTNKNEKNGKNEKKVAHSRSLEEFDSFWSGCHVRPGSKKKAGEAWVKIRKEGRTTKTWEEILGAFNAFVEHEKRKNNGSTQFVPHIVTWLNQDRWDDELAGQSNTTTGTNKTCPKGRPYPPGCEWDQDVGCHRGPNTWEIDEERIMKMWQELGNEENAKLWKPFDWADFQDMEAAI